MNNKIKIILLSLIVFIAAILRLLNLGGVPPSPDWDEVSLGYNAYSIMVTGRDEYGKFLPVVLRSFDDYKPALYAYFAIPFIKLFGLNIFSVRLVSAIFGILTVIATYFLGEELFVKGRSTQQKNNLFCYVGLVSAFLLSISPWHIQFSRIAFESNVGLSLNVFALLFFLIGLRKKWFMPLSFFLGALNIYMYQSEKVFTPLLFMALIIIYKKEFFKINKKILIASFVIALIVLTPMVYYMYSDPNTFLRAKGVSVFSDQTQFLKRNAQKIIIDTNNKDYFGLIVDNRRIEYVRSVISGYVSHFDLNWLFITSDINRHHAPFMGLLYLFEFPFLLIGIYKLIFGDFDKKTKLIIFSYFLLVPIPASITSGVPHSVRTLNFLPMFQIFTAIGFVTAYQIIKSRRIIIKILIYTVFIAIFLLNVFYYLNQYFVQQNYFYSKDWQYGYKEAVGFIKPIMGDYDKIVVSNQPPLDQSYMFFLFYSQFDPKKYQSLGGTGSGGFKENHKGFLNLSFRPIDWNTETKNSRILFIGRPNDFPDDANVVKVINYLNGDGAIKIVKG